MTARAPPSFSDRDAEGIIAALLRAGVMLAAAVVLLGAVVYLARHGGERVDFSVFRGEPARSRRFWDIVRDAAAGRGRGILELGVLLLIATPVLRVVFSVVAFTRERDWMYVMFTLVVLAVLFYGLFGPHA